MNRASLFQGMKGKKETTPASIRANAQISGKGHSYNRDVTFGKVPYKKAPAMFSGVIDYSTRRGVLPCYNINRFVLRNPPEFIPQHGLRPQGGQSRTQNPSWANPRPLNLPIHQPRSSMNGGLPSRIHLPGLAYVK